MLIGYNKPLPSREDYISFMRNLTKGLEGLGKKGLSLMIYGSFVRGDYNPGRSDIDAVLIFPDDVVINKTNLHVVSLELCEALKKNFIPFQVTATDIKTLEDGRFSSFTPDFQEYFMEEGKIVVGPDYRRQFRLKMPKHPKQITITFNLKKSRQGLLFAIYEAEQDYESFLNKFHKSLDAISRSSKELLSMCDGQPRKERFSALNTLQTFFPEIETSSLNRIRELYREPEKLVGLYKNRIEIMNLWNSSLNFFESLVRSYIRKFPNSKED